MSTMPKPVMIAHTAEGLPLGRCLYTSQRGWKFIPMTNTHQPSRKFWGNVDECVPPWAERQMAGLIPLEQFNAKFPAYALKTSSALPLTSPSTILAMTAKQPVTLLDVVTALTDAEKEIRRLHEIHADAFEGKIGEPDLTVADNIHNLLARLEK